MSEFSQAIPRAFLAAVQFQSGGETFARERYLVFAANLQQAERLGRDLAEESAFFNSRIPDLGVLVWIETDPPGLGAGASGFASLNPDRLRAAIGEVPEPEGLIFLLHCVEGLAYEEIAARLGIPTSPVERGVAQAIRAIIEALGEGHGATRSDP